VLGLELELLEGIVDLLKEGDEVVVRELVLDPEVEAVDVAVAVAELVEELDAELVLVAVIVCVEVVVPLGNGVLVDVLDPDVVLVTVVDDVGVRDTVIVRVPDEVVVVVLETDTDAVFVGDEVVERVADEECVKDEDEDELLVAEDDPLFVLVLDELAEYVELSEAFPDTLEVLEFVGDFVLVLELLVVGDVVADVDVVRLPDTDAVFVTDVVDVLVADGLGEPDLAAVGVRDPLVLVVDVREPVAVLDIDAELVPVLEPVPVRDPVGVALDERLPVAVLVVVTLVLDVRLADAERLVVGEVVEVLEEETVVLTVVECVDVLDTVVEALVVLDARGERELEVVRDAEKLCLPLPDEDTDVVDVLEPVPVLEPDGLPLGVLEMVPLLETVGDAEDVRVPVAEREVMGDALELLVADAVVVDVRLEDDVREEDTDVVPVRDPELVLEFVEDAVEVLLVVDVRVLVGVPLDVSDGLEECVDVNDGRELIVALALRELERDAVAVSVLNAAIAANCLSRAGLTTIREVSSNGGVSLYVDNTNRAKRHNRRSISLVDSAFFLKASHARLNIYAYYNRIIIMSRPQVFTLIRGEKNSGSTYYTKGIHLCNIPFHEFSKVQLQLITLYGRAQFIYDLLPAFIKFQKIYRRRYKWIHNPRWILQGQLTGQPRDRLPWL
jgi:hypothetical protein